MRKRGQLDRAVLVIDDGPAGRGEGSWGNGGEVEDGNRKGKQKRKAKAESKRLEKGKRKAKAEKKMGGQNDGGKDFANSKQI